MQGQKGSYVRKTPDSGYGIHRAKTGFVINMWSNLSGERTDRRWLVPYGVRELGPDADLAAAWNDFVTVGDMLYIMALDGGHGRILRRGRLVE